MPGRRFASSWEHRQPTAVWRGSLNGGLALNSEWSSKRVIRSIRAKNGHWKQLGRLALLYQHCMRPDLLDVKVLGGFKALELNASDFHECVKLTRGLHGHMPLAQQAAAYRYVVHVDGGNGGWSDRLKHLLLSGMMVLKQDMGVSEYFEPLLKPWVHFVPVDSVLRNLSDAILWARREDLQARAIAERAASFAEEMLSESAIAFYQEEMFAQYAALFKSDATELRAHRAARVSHTARFDCQVQPQDSIDCFLVHPAHSVRDVAAHRGSVRDVVNNRPRRCKSGSEPC